MVKWKSHSLLFLGVPLYWLVLHLVKNPSTILISFLCFFSYGYLLSGCSHNTSFIRITVRHADYTENGLLKISIPPPSVTPQSMSLLLSPPPLLLSPPSLASPPSLPTHLLGIESKA